MCPKLESAEGVQIMASRDDCIPAEVRYIYYPKKQ